MTRCPVYDAEDVAWALHDAFQSVVPDPQAFVGWVTTHEPFVSLRRKARLPDTSVTVTVGDRRDASLGHAWLQHVEIAPTMKPTQGLLLHELAHLCTPAHEAHSHLFVANYLSLVRAWLGEEPAKILLRLMRAHKAFP